MKDNLPTKESIYLTVISLSIRREETIYSDRYFSLPIRREESIHPDRYLSPQFGGRSLSTLTDTSLPIRREETIYSGRYFSP